jgi:hypothetical protein
MALASVVGNASLNGSIIIMRYGRIFRGDKVCAVSLLLCIVIEVYVIVRLNCR